jgi:hypothetical protein
MSERSGRLPLVVIAGLILVVVAFLILTLRQFVPGLDRWMPLWPLWLAVLFNAAMLVFTAVIIVGQFEWRPVAKVFVVALASKAILTVLTAAGFLVLGTSSAFGPALAEAGLKSLSASLLHMIGMLFTAWVLRDLVLGRGFTLVTAPEELILPSLTAPEMVAGEPSPDEGLWLAPREPGVEAAESPAAVQEVEAAGEEELDRVVAASRPVTADLEEMADLAEPAEPSAGREDDIVLSIGEVLGCLPAADVALGPAEVCEQRGGDELVRIPLAEVLPQLGAGVVLVEADLIFRQLPRAAFARSPEEITADLWQGKVELPLERVVAQVPLEAMTRTYGAEQEKADEFAEPFRDTLAGAGRPAEKAREPGAAAAGQEPAGPQEAVEAAAPAVGPAPSPRAMPKFFTVDAEYVIAQFPENSMVMAIEDIEALLEPRGKLQVSVEEVMPQLAHGHVTAYVVPLLEQLPPGAVAIRWAQLAAALPDGKVTLPLEQIVCQVPAGALALPAEQMEQEAAEEVPQLFAEGRPAGAAEPKPAEKAAAAPPAPAAPVEEICAEPVEMARIEPVEMAPGQAEEAAKAAEAAEEAVEIAWLDLLPQFPADAFSVSREQLRGALAGQTVRMDVRLIRPQLTEGRITVPCGYLLSKFPSEYLELSPEQMADRLPKGRFEIPLAAVVSQLAAQELAPPAEQAAQESADEVPTLFAEPEGEPPVASIVEPAAEPAALEAEPAIEVAAQAVETPTAAEAGPPEALTDEDVAQLDSLLASKRREEAGYEDEGEFIEELFAPEEAEEPGILAPVFEPEAAEPTRTDEQEAPVVEPVEAFEPFAGIEEPEAAPWVPVEVPGEAMPTAVEPEPAPEPEVAPQPAASEAAAAAISPVEAVHESAAFRKVLEGYSKYHIEQGSAYLGDGRLIFAFTAPEVSDEALAREVPPRLEALERFAEQLGCGPLREAVLSTDKGAVACEWLPAEGGGGLVLIATTDKHVAGVVHLQARHDTPVLSEVSAELWTAPPQPRPWPPGLEPAGCEVQRPGGRPYDEIGALLEACEVKTVALLQFASGTRWVLASLGPAHECASLDALLELPEALRLGQVRSVLAVAERNVITVNAPAPGKQVGLICVFPGQYREGLLKMKADRAAALLSDV